MRGMKVYRKLLRNVPIKQKRSARMRPDACGICLLKQTASGAQSVTSPSKIEGFREFEADLSRFVPLSRKDCGSAKALRANEALS